MGKKRKARQILRLEMPFSAAPPELTAESVGIPRIVRRASVARESDITVFDAPDGRLLREGIILAHRLADGAGEWTMSGLNWSSALPDETREPADSDLPTVFLTRGRPITRGAVLGPIAALHCVQQTWSLRGLKNEVVADVLDEQVTVRRSGVATARYRQITITALQPLSGQQREFLISAAAAVNATVVDDFPSLQQRIGAPATGLSGFPAPREITRQFSLEEFVSAVFARHLRAITEAELNRRVAADEDIAKTNALLWDFALDLRGLSWVIEPNWRREIEQQLATLPYATVAELDPALQRILNALVSAVQAPRLGNSATEPASWQVFQRAEQAALILADRCRALKVDTPDEHWLSALRSAEQLDVTASVAEPLFRKPMRSLVSLLGELTEELRQCTLGRYAGEPELDGLSAKQAYQLGMETQQAKHRVTVARQRFIKRWPARVQEARILLSKAKKKQ